MTKMSDGNSEDFLKIESSLENNGNNPNVESIQNQIDLKWEFRDETWRNPNIVYHPMPNSFSGNRRGLSRNYSVL